MKRILYCLGLVTIFPLLGHAQLSQTFEDGEDTTNWGASWTGGGVTATFLDEALGGENAGDGTSSTQSFSRSFKNNTVGLDLSEAYSMSMYVQLNTFDGPAGGVFEIVDGDYGTGNAGNLRVTTTGTPGVFKWQARDQNSGWLDLDIELDLANPYRVVIDVNPATFTYSATIQLTDAAGNILDTGSLSGLAFDQNVINNHQNGTLLFYIQASAGGTEAMVDNINIGGVPEPSAVLLAGCSLTVMFLRRRWRDVA